MGSGTLNLARRTRAEASSAAVRKSTLALSLPFLTRCDPGRGDQREGRSYRCPPVRMLVRGRGPSARWWGLTLICNGQDFVVGPSRRATVETVSQ